MENIVEHIAYCVAHGKVNYASPYPAEMKGQPGADELTLKALEEGITATEILHNGFIRAMDAVGQLFSEKKIFVPQMLLAARAMNTAMRHLQPYFDSGETTRKGILVIGTVAGDLHEIGKNLAAMIIAGNGWEVIDLGKDVAPAVFIEKVKQHPGCLVGLSALLTTTMVAMKDTVRLLREEIGAVKIIVGGAPVNAEFCNAIGADCYAADPQEAVNYLKSLHHQCA